MEDHPIDYRGLLVRYMALVIGEESISFMEHYHEDSHSFTAEELFSLELIEGEAKKLAYGD